MTEPMSTWRTFELYVAGNNEREALHGLLWDNQGEAEEYARENGLAHVYKLDMIASVANMTALVEEDDEDEDNECEGHESLAGEHMGETVYCDGSCR